jgi:acyl-coenzyme A synthetase/AMP-(fatty) acid ligase
MSLVHTRKNPITGALVVADVVLQNGPANGHAAALQREILALCAGALPRHKVPAKIRFVNELPVAATGKLVRRHA